MPRIPEETIDEIRQRADIVDIVGSFVQLKHQNGDWWGCCPFHKEKTASFKVNKERQAYYCFGCKAHGSVIDFVKEIVNTDFVGAVRWLADRLGIEIPEGNFQGSKEQSELRRQLREKRQNLLELAAGWYHVQLNTPQAEIARNYLASRGLDADAVEHFKLGYSPQSYDALIQWAHSMGFNDEDLLATELVSHREEDSRMYDRFRGRLMFPIWNELGKVVGFSARVLDATAKAAKYVNSPESDFFHKGQILYGFNFARQELKKFDHVLICEGQLDVIACHRAGLVNAVAAQGTAFTEEHARMLKKSTDKIVLSFDADTAGNKAAERTIKMLHGMDFSVSVATLPEGEDPDSVFRKGGGEALRKIMSVTQPAVHYLFNVAKNANDMNSAEGMSAVVRYVLEAVRPIRDAVIRASYCKWLAAQVGHDERTIVNELESMQVPDARPRTAQQAIQRIPTRQVPRFYTPSVETQTWYMLLDLTLHFQKLAQDFAFLEEVIIAIPPTPLGQAINYVALYTQQDEWEGLSDIIMKMDVFADADVAKAVVASEYKEYVPAEGAIPPNVQKAFDDCVVRVKLEALEKTIAEKQQQIQNEPDVGRQRQLFDELNALTARKREMKDQLRRY
ncbi:MAG: DNA primase [Victivallales bacterium]|nr:DNA primase [Victivallales bacterium]